MAKKKLTREEMLAKREELQRLFDEHNHDDDAVLELLADENGEVEENDFWILRLVLADYQINYRSPPQDDN